MKRKIISTAALLAMLPATSAFAAALDRSGQPVAPLFQDGNLVELGYTWLSPTVKGVENNTAKSNIPDMAGDYTFPSAALKYQATDKLSLAFLYDHPFGAEAGYSGVNGFTTTPAALAATPTAVVAGGYQAEATKKLTAAGYSPAQIAGVLPGMTQQYLASQQGKGKVAALTPTPTGSNNTNVSVTTQSFSLVAGFQPNKNWNIYGGPVYQTIKGDVHLRGSAYSVFNGYDANLSTSGGWGFLAGAAYQIPEIAFRAALTYRSAITHNASTTENFGNYQKLGGAVGTSSTTKIKTPQSINLDLQSGIAANTVAFANLRWVNWSGFSIKPGQFGAIAKDLGPAVGKPNGFPLIEYNKDQYSANLGVGRKFNDQWAGNVSVGWDSGTGTYASTLGPVNGYWNVGVGAQYSPVKNFYVSLGAKYFWMGDAKSQVSSIVGTKQYNATFSNNNAVAVGMKVGYRF